MRTFIVVGPQRVARAFLEDRGRAAALKGEKWTLRSNGPQLIIGEHTRYIASNDGNHFMGLAGVEDVFVLDGADPDAAAVAWYRATRPPTSMPWLSIDIVELYRMGAGDRARTLQELGHVLRPFCPDACDHLDVADGALRTPAPDGLEADG